MLAPGAAAHVQQHRQQEMSAASTQQHVQPVMPAAIARAMEPVEPVRNRLNRFVYILMNSCVVLIISDWSCSKLTCSEIKLVGTSLVRSYAFHACCTLLACCCRMPSMLLHAARMLLPYAFHVAVCCSHVAAACFLAAACFPCCSILTNRWGGQGLANGFTLLRAVGRC